ncbi:PTS system mannitol-specific IIBC component [Spiroplasma sabaudiense Ar-1343]|uniref:PTS system mannitol-specific IIBC component n=1 Tax=Spiroplasma sabaudiense Ar-1343 TaxID=1276257 RepID=W6AB97_9MOLU|nr:PTS mannitol transporter subunit IICB [Spiroplasma sabaudiense]AHI54261.1 PTS system mannitol-specific IIBC component [Spiroplasma sabaudiense Ar-1343]
MKEVIKELDSKLSSKERHKLFWKRNFDKQTIVRRIQKFGGWLSSMIMPMIGIMIAWGLLTAFFIPTGWTPVAIINDYIIVNMMTYLLPTLIAFNAGKIVHGTRGGMVATLVVFGVIAGNQVNPGFIDGSTPSPQFLAAMMVGPLAAGILKGFDKLVENRIKQGFEMLVNNFSLGILGAIMCVGSFYGMPYVFNSISWAFAKAVEFLINNSMIFLAAIIIEPAKVLFLNNAINHGVLTPIGTQLVAEHGKSVLFLLEANPGPGFGLLVAIILFDKKSRGNAAGASVIHLFGGIHEVYFPFVLMRFEMLLALIGGGIAGNAIFQIFNVGLIAPASPGSIIAIFIFAQSSGLNYLWLSVGILASSATAFGTAALIFIINRKKYSKQGMIDLNLATKKTLELKGKKSNVLKLQEEMKKPQLIIFACEAGMGSSAMGAGLLRKHLKAADLEIEVKNFPIKELPENSEFVITQSALTPLAMKKCPKAIHRSISNFLDNNFYKNIIEEIQVVATKEKELR